MIKITISGLLFATVVFLSFYTLPPYYLELIALITIFPILTGGFAIGFFISAWSKTNRVASFKNSLKYTFGLSSLLFISGYIFASIQGLI